MAQLWLNSIKIVFRLTNCPDDQKIQCAEFMLRDDIIEILIYLSLLDDGSPTSANLGNDHWFISEEY